MSSEDTYVPTSYANSKQLEIWEHIKSHLNNWYHKPDTESIKFALSQYCAHFLSTKPIFSFILGRSGEGKSSLIINPMEKLLRCKSVDSITPKSFYSGYSTGKSGKSGKSQYGGLLDRLDEVEVTTPAGKEKIKDGVILISDFSTITGMDPKQFYELQSMFRRLYDGKLTKDLGNGPPREFKGKVSMICCGTYNVEDYWSLDRSLGERFITYKIPYNDSEDHDRSIRSMELMNDDNDGQDIEHTYLQLVQDLIGNPIDRMPDKPKDFGDLETIAQVACLIERLRIHVERDYHETGKPITKVHPPASPTRLSIILQNLTFGHACLFGKSEVDMESINFAKRIAINSVNSTRYRIFSTVYNKGGKNVSAMTVFNHAGMTRTGYTKHIEELTEIGIIIQHGKGIDNNTYSLHPKIMEFATKSKMLFPAIDANEITRETSNEKTRGKYKAKVNWALDKDPELLEDTIVTPDLEYLN